MKWKPDAGTILAGVSLLLAGGVAYGTVESKAEQNARDIREIKSGFSQMQRDIGDIKENTAAIHGKLEVIFPPGSLTRLEHRRIDQ